MSMEIFNRVLTLLIAILNATSTTHLLWQMPPVILYCSYFGMDWFCIHAALSFLPASFHVP